MIICCEDNVIIIVISNNKLHMDNITLCIYVIIYHFIIHCQMFGREPADFMYFLGFVVT